MSALASGSPAGRRTASAKLAHHRLRRQCRCDHRPVAGRNLRRPLGQPARLIGMARLDYAADTLVVTRDNTADLVLNPLIKELENPAPICARRAQRLPAGGLAEPEKPYGLSFPQYGRGLYQGIRSGALCPPPRPARSRAASATRWIAACRHRARPPGKRCARGSWSSAAPALSAAT